MLSKPNLKINPSTPTKLSPMHMSSPKLSLISKLEDRSYQVKTEVTMGAVVQSDRA